LRAIVFYENRQGIHENIHPLKSLFQRVDILQHFNNNIAITNNSLLQNDKASVKIKSIKQVRCFL